MTYQTMPPTVMGEERAAEAERRRIEMAKLAAMRPRPSQTNNDEENKFSLSQPTSFTKGLTHNEYGLVARAEYETFRDALVQQSRSMANLTIAAEMKGQPARKWESPLAGHYFETQGPDMDAVSMAPAPKLGRSELTAELASVYAMALTRDLTFHDLADPTKVLPQLSFPAGHVKANQPVMVGDLVAELRKLAWFDPDQTPVGFFGTLTEHEKRRRRAQWDGHDGLTLKTLFRGSTAGAKSGPYLSQFMMIGSVDKRGSTRASDGCIAFGLQAIDQRVEVAEAGQDFMTSWSDWLEVQNGADTTGGETYLPEKRFINTPRDLAGYVHFDALYQAYLNACLIMLGNGMQVDLGNPIQRSRDCNSQGFATWGGPHILSLVTEVATRALRAVRAQKFQVHRRARPEVLAARLAQVASGHIGRMDTGAVKLFGDMLHELGHDDPLDDARPGLILHWIAEHNRQFGEDDTLHPDKNYLLPMAFSEGSPMHPAYGAGHATVAGACVTILKAFFDSERRYLDALPSVNQLYHPAPDGKTLVPWTSAGSGQGSAQGAGPANPTIAEELDKLAANVSIGRNMAGVHYYTDYYDSLRLGERIAAAVLEEQMLTYSEPVRLSFTSFDGDAITIETDGGQTEASVSLSVYSNGVMSTDDEWWLRDVIEYQTAGYAVASV